MGNSHLRIFGMMATAASVIASLPSDGDTTVYSRWSDPATWGGSSPPMAGESVTISPGQAVLLDVITPALGALVINGKFKFDSSQNVHLTADSIIVAGTAEWRIGAASVPYRQQAGITLTGQMPTVSGNPGGGPLVRGRSFVGNTPTGNNSTTNDNAGISRGIIVMPGAKVGWYGAVPADLKASLNQHAMPGDTSITLDRGVTWKQGDKIVIPPTGYPSSARATEVYVVAVNTNGSNVVQLTTPITFKRWGLMQYPTDTGISLSPGPFTLRSTANPNGMRATVDVPAFIDQRAPVENISRNCLVQGGIEDGYGGDVAWRRDGFGAHMMVMGLASDVVIDGFGFDRVGQRGLLGRYPFHWHMLSYDAATGNLLGDIPAGKGVFSRNAITNSENRAVTIHGTCGAQVIGNTAFGIKGHAYFLEDGSEERNTISGNSGWFLRSMDDPYRLKAHDGQTSMLWVSNWNNHIVGNSGADIYGVGFFNSPHMEHPWSSVPVFTGSGRASFSASVRAVYAASDRNAAIALSQTHTLTCTNATAPATFSHGGSVSGALGQVTVGSDFSDGYSTWQISGPTTPFVVGDTVTFVTRVLACTGPSRFANVHPSYQAVLEYDNNRAWCVWGTGIDAASLPKDEEGNTAPSFKIQSTTDGVPGEDFGNSKQIQSLFTRFQLHHCSNGGYKNRVADPHYKSWTQTDNMTVDFFGQTNAGNLTDVLLVHRTFNRDINDGTHLVDAETHHHAAMASYHGTLSFQGVSAFDYLATPQSIEQGVGDEALMLMATAVIQSWDLYLEPIDKSMQNNTNFCFWNCTPMFRTPPPWMVPTYFPSVTNFQQFAWGHQAAAVWDPNGVLTGVSGSYLCLGHPFISYGMRNRALQQPTFLQGIITTDRMIGVVPTSRDLPSPEYWDAGNGQGIGSTDGHNHGQRSFTFQRFDTATLTHALAPDGSQLADYVSPLDGGALAFRNCGLPTGGAVFMYPTVFAGVSSQVYASGYLVNCEARVDGGDAANDTVTVGLPWSGSKPAHCFSGGGLVHADGSGLSSDEAYNGARPAGDYLKISGGVTLTSVGSPAALNASAGNTFWQDSANNRVWMKLLPPPGSHVGNGGSFPFLINDGSNGAAPAPAPATPAVPSNATVVALASTGDMTDTINNAIAAAPANSTVRFTGTTAHHSYALGNRQGAFAVADNVRLHFDAQLVADDEQNSALYFTGATGLTISGLNTGVATLGPRRGSYFTYKTTFVGCAGLALYDPVVRNSAAAGIFLDNCAGFTIVRPTVSGTLADGIHMTNGSKNGVVYDPRINNPGDDQIAVVSYAQDASICDNIVVWRPVTRGQNTSGRGLTVVGGSNIHYYDVDVDGTYGGALCHMCESNSDFATQMPVNCSFERGTVKNWNQAASLDHGGYFALNQKPNSRMTDLQCKGITFTDTPNNRPVVNAKNNNVGGALMGRILCQDITATGAYYHASPFNSDSAIPRAFNTTLQEDGVTFNNCVAQ